MTEVDEIFRIKRALPWRPEAGDRIDGDVVRIMARTTIVEGKPSKYPILIVNAGEPEYRAVHAFHSILQDQLREARVKAGDKVSIFFGGEVESKNKNAKGEARSYYDYSVVVNGEDTAEEYLWDNPALDKADDEPGF